MLCPLSYRRTESESIIAHVSINEHRFRQKPQSYLATTEEQRFPLKQAIENYLLSCKVEGKSLATVQAYRDKLYPFLWYCKHYHLPDDVNSITTSHLREFLAYLRDNPVRFGGKSHSSRKPVNKTTVQRYYRILSSFWNWLVDEELSRENPLIKIKTPKAEKKIIKGLTIEEVNILIASFGNSFSDKRNRASLLIFIDCGLRLGELLTLKLGDIDFNTQTIRVSGKTGERTVRFGTLSSRALMKYLISRNRVSGNTNSLWLNSNGHMISASGIRFVPTRRLS